MARSDDMQPWGRRLVAYGDRNIRKTRSVFMFIPVLIRRFFEITIFPIAAFLDKVFAILGLNGKFKSLLEQLDDDGNPIPGSRPRVGFITYILQIPLVLLESAFAWVHQLIVRVVSSVIYVLGLGNDADASKRPVGVRTEAHSMGWVKFIKDSYKKLADKLNTATFVERFAMRREKVHEGMSKFREYAHALGCILYLMTLLPLIARGIDWVLDKGLGIRPEGNSGSKESPLFGSEYRLPFSIGFRARHEWLDLKMGHAGYVQYILDAVVSLIFRAFEMVYQALEYVYTMFRFLGAFSVPTAKDDANVEHTEKYKESLEIERNNRIKDICLLGPQFEKYDKDYFNSDSKTPGLCDVMQRSPSYKNVSDRSKKDLNDLKDELKPLNHMIKKINKVVGERNRLSDEIHLLDGKIGQREEDKKNTVLAEVRLKLLNKGYEKVKYVHPMDLDSLRFLTKVRTLIGLAGGIGNKVAYDGVFREYEMVGAESKEALKLNVGEEYNVVQGALKTELSSLCLKLAEKSHQLEHPMETEQTFHGSPLSVGSSASDSEAEGPAPAPAPRPV